MAYDSPEMAASQPLSADVGLLDRQRHSPACLPSHGDRNISGREREWSVASGAALLVAGLAGPQRLRAISLLAGAGLLYRGISGHCHLYQALGIDSSRSQLNGERGVPARSGFQYEQAIAIQKPVAELYQTWKKFSELPLIMQHLERVTEQGDRRTEWVARGPLDSRLTWQAELIEDRENELIAWQSLPGGDVDTAGSIHFRPLGDGRGTSIKVSLKYNPPGGKATAALAWLVGQGAEARIDEDLHRFKSRLEAGESPTTSDQPHGPRE